MRTDPAAPRLPGRLDAALAGLRDQPITGCEKGFGGSAPVTAAELAAMRPSLFGGAFTMPVMTLRESGLRQNIDAMADWCTAAGVDLAPHGKTPMAPQLMARQLAAGGWAVTAATAGHMRVYRQFGIPRILLANELTDRAGLAWLAAEMAADPGFDCYVYADSIDGVRLLDTELSARPPGRPLPVLVELGFAGGRTGCRTIPQAVEVASAVVSAGSLTLAGVAGYEGGLGHDCDPGTLEAVAAFCRDLRALGERLRPMAGDPDGFVLTAGGSAFFDVVAAELTRAGPGYRVVLRSGAYITHDHGLYAGLTPGAAGSPGRAGPALVPAIELWAQVLSRPEPELALLCAGRRDTSFDQGMPVPLRIGRPGGPQASARGMHVQRLDDQHAYLGVPGDCALAPGDLICLGISHPCTAFDKWRVIPVTDDEYRVVDAVHTFF